MGGEHEPGAGAGKPPGPDGCHVGVVLAGDEDVGVGIAKVPGQGSQRREYPVLPQVHQAHTCGDLGAQFSAGVDHHKVDLDPRRPQASGKATEDHLDATAAKFGHEERNPVGHSQPSVVDPPAISEKRRSATSSGCAPLDQSDVIDAAIPPARLASSGRQARWTNR